MVQDHFLMMSLMAPLPCYWRCNAQYQPQNHSFHPTEIHDSFTKSIIKKKPKTSQMKTLEKADDNPGDNCSQQFNFNL